MNALEKNLKSTKVVSVLVIIFLVVSTVLALAIILFGDFSGTEVKILLSAVTWASCGILLLPGLNLLERGKYRPLGRVAVLVSAVFLGYGFGAYMERRANVGNYLLKADRFRLRDWDFFK